MYLVTSLEGSSMVEETKRVATSLDLLVNLLRGANKVRAIREDALGNGAAGIRAGGGKLRASSGKRTSGRNQGDQTEDDGDELRERPKSPTHSCGWSERLV